MMSGFKKSTLVLAPVLCLALLSVFAAPQNAGASNVLRELEESFVGIAEKVKPSIVHVTSEVRILKSLKGRGGEGDLHRFFGPGVGPGIKNFKARTTGSGVIMTKDGYILTNNHLVQDSDAVMVKITGSDGDRGKKYEGNVVGRDKATDLAVIKIEPTEPLIPVTLGDSTKLKVGQWAIAIGDPFGIEKTFTVGVISGLGRSGFRGPLREVRYQDFIQTDASINQGNSGGPLLNIDGEVIGINTFIHAAAQNIGFAIPIKMAKEVYDELVKHGEVARGFLGVGIDDLNEGLAAAMNAPDLKGAIVRQTYQDMPAHKAGIEHGDIIREVDGHVVENADSLKDIIGHKRPGEKVQVTLLRKGEKKNITIELMKFPEQSNLQEPVKKREDPLGITVGKIPEGLALPNEKGVQIKSIKPDSPAEEGGLVVGDIILEINMQGVGNKREFAMLVDKLLPGQWASFYVRRGGDILYRALKIPAN
jgi:Do/DeqQ family serine protease